MKAACAASVSPRYCRDWRRGKPSDRSDWRAGRGVRDCRISADETSKIRRDFVKHGPPVGERLLPVERRARIEQAVTPVVLPDPMRVRVEQHPRGLAERAAQVRDRRTDGDHEIERADEGGRVVERSPLPRE